MPAVQEAMTAEEMSDVVWLTPLMYKSESARDVVVVGVVAGPGCVDVVASSVVGGDFLGTVVVVDGRMVVGVAIPGRGGAPLPIARALTVAAKARAATTTAIKAMRLRTRGD
jgi:hypothetical protein